MLEKAISGIDQGLALTLYGDTVDEIISLDKDNAAGLKDKYAKLRKDAQAEAKQQELFTESRKLFVAGDKEGAKKMLLEAQKLAPNTRIGKQIPQIIQANFKKRSKPNLTQTASGVKPDSPFFFAYAFR